ncbi:hypothetical protein [Streptomyces sp. NPDC094437]|uniref:hypothetical protein n=1 Tax=Streptomyces sp. NPDC094437 TaxID=3366060 RepID=UPI00381E3086
MTASAKTRRLRMAAIGTACAAALLAGGAGASVASAADQPAAAAAPTASAMAPKAKASITVTADKHTVKAKDSVMLSGMTKGLRNGTKLQVQHWNKGKWTSLHSTTVVKKDKYSVKVKLNDKGVAKLRVVHGDTHSRPTMVTVN